MNDNNKTVLTEDEIRGLFPFSEKVGAATIDVARAVESAVLAKLGGMPAEEWMNRAIYAAYQYANAATAHAKGLGSVHSIHEKERALTDVLSSRILPAASEAATATFHAGPSACPTCRQWEALGRPVGSTFDPCSHHCTYEPVDTSSEAGAVPVALFGEAIAWGRFWGPEIPDKQWDQMRNEQARNFARRLAAPPAPIEQVDVDDWRETVGRAADDIAYAVFNLADAKLADLPTGVSESTDPVVTALIAERDLRSLLDRNTPIQQAAPAAEPLDDLAALVRQLVRALRKAAPGNDLANKALDYLRRIGLQGSPFRSDVETQPGATAFDGADAWNAAPAAESAEPDPCPGCDPGRFCKTPKCGRLAKASAATADAQGNPAECDGIKVVEFHQIKPAAQGDDVWPYLNEWRKAVIALSRAPKDRLDIVRENEYRAHCRLMERLGYPTEDTRIADAVALRDAVLGRKTDAQGDERADLTVSEWVARFGGRQDDAGNICFRNWSAVSGMLAEYGRAALSRQPSAPASGELRDVLNAARLAGWSFVKDASGRYSMQPRIQGEAQAAPASAALQTIAAFEVEGGDYRSAMNVVRATARAALAGAKPEGGE